MSENFGNTATQIGRLSSKDCFDMLEHAPIGVFTSTPEGRFFSVNPALVRMYGYATREELIDSISDITSQLYADPADRDAFRRLLEEQGKLINYEYRLLRKDGSIFWVSTTVRSVRDEQGNIIYYQGFTTEITDRKLSEAAAEKSWTMHKQAEDALLRKHSFLQGILESSPTPFFSVDREYRYTSFNLAHARQMKELYGVDIERGHSLYNYQTVPEDSLKSRTNIDRALRGEQFIEEACYGRQDLSRQYINVTHNPIPDVYGQIIGVSVFFQDISQRKQAENELKMNQEFLEAVFNSIQDGICVLDTHMNILKSNEKMLKWYGTGIPLEGTKCYIAYHGRSEPCDICPTARSLVTGKREMDEIPLVQGAVNTGVLEVYAFPMLDENGRPTAVVKYVRDITERKNAEDNLLASEEKYRSLVEQSADMIYLHDLKGQFLDVNQTAVLNTGYSREELLGMNVFDIHLDQSSHDEILRVWEEWQSGQSEIYETMHLRKDGSTFVAEVKAGKVHFGGEDYILALVRDSTKRKRAEEALRESEEKFRIVFEQSAIGMGLVNLTDARWINVNESFCNMLGYTPEEMRATLWQDITHPDDVDLDHIPFRRMAAGILENYTVEKRIIHKQGHHVWARLTLSIVRDHNGRPDYKIAIIENITQRKMAEEALQALTDTLEQQVAERTELAEARSLKLQKLSEELIVAEERERRRIADLLHDDLQHYLVSAGMQVQATRERHPSIESLKKLETTLKESIEKSRNLSHELTPPPVLQQGDLADTIEWLAHRIKKQFGLQVKVERTATPRLKNALLKLFIFRTVQELLFNSVKHSGVEEAWVIFSGNEYSFSITVTDQGRGFDPDILSSHEIAGLGLSRLAQRANSIGCNLDIKSAPGQGSRITLTVPVSLVEND